MESDLQITIAGPGRCFDYEIQLLQETLESAGFKINMINAYPISGNKKLSRTNKTVTLVIEHCPWGG